MPRLFWRTSFETTWPVRLGWRLLRRAAGGVTLERVFFGMAFLVVLQGEVFRKVERDQNRDKGFSEVLEGTD